MDNVIDPAECEHLSGASPLKEVTLEAQIEARLRMESMSRVACALIFQSARDLACARRRTGKARVPSPKALREALQWIDEISVWAKTIHPLRYENGGLTLAGAVETINVHQDYRGGKRIEYWVVRELLLREPHRLAVIDGPAEFRTLTSDPSDRASSVAMDADSVKDLIRLIGAYEQTFGGQTVPGVLAERP